MDSEAPSKLRRRSRQQHEREEGKRFGKQGLSLMRIHRSRMERVMDTQSHEDSLGIVVADKTTQHNSLSDKKETTFFSLYERAEIATR